MYPTQIKSGLLIKGIQPLYSPYICLHLVSATASIPVRIRRSASCVDWQVLVEEVPGALDLSMSSVLRSLVVNRQTSPLPLRSTYSESIRTSVDRSLLR